MSLLANFFFLMK